jgi:hypothetical protein
MLNRPRPRIMEPQPLQLAGDVDLSEQRRMVTDVGVVRRQVHPRRTLLNGNHVPGPGRLRDPGRGAARPQVTAAHDQVNGQHGKALGEAAGVLCPQRGERIRVVLVAGLKGVGGVRFALAVANDDELLVLSHAAARCTAARMNS